MKQVLAVKSLPLKAINRTMKRLLVPLLAALALLTAVIACNLGVADLMFN